MSRLIPPPTFGGPFDGLQPINDAELVLYDPSGIVNTWEIVDGVVTVEMNAVIGQAWLLRPISIQEASIFVGFVESVETSNPVGSVGLFWGIGGDVQSDPIEFMGVGVLCKSWPGAYPGMTINNLENFGSASPGLYKGVIVTQTPILNTNQTTSGMVSNGGVRSDTGAVNATGYHRQSGSATFAHTHEGLRISNQTATAGPAGARISYKWTVTPYGAEAEISTLGAASAGVTP